MAKKAKNTARRKAVLGHFNHDDFMQLLGMRIKNLRKDGEFKSAELFAYDIEVSRVGMSKYETGAFDDIRLRTLLKIIDGLEMTPVEFFTKGFEGIKFIANPKQ